MTMVAGTIGGFALAAAGMGPASAAGMTAQAAGSCSLTATIATGRNPGGIAVNPQTNSIYVANAADDTVSVIGGQADTVTATIPVGTRPVRVAVNPTTNTTYTVNIGDWTVSALAC